MLLDNGTEEFSSEVLENESKTSTPRDGKVLMVQSHCTGPRAVSGTGRGAVLAR